MNHRDVMKALGPPGTGCFLVREGVDDLLGRPFSGGIRSNVEVNDLPPVATEYDKEAQDTSGHGRDREELAGGDVADVIAQEPSPGMGRRFPSAHHVLGHGLFDDIVAEQGQFGYNPRCTQVGFSRDVRRTKLRMLRLMDRRPGLPGLDLHLQ